MCQLRKPFFPAINRHFFNDSEPGAQGFAQVAQALLRKVSLGCAAFSLLASLFACALPSPSPSSSSMMRAKQAATSRNTVDALLPSGRNLFLFDFAQSRYQKWPLASGPDTGDGTRNGLCGIADTLKGDWSAPSHWLALPSPVQPFTPTQAIWGPSGNFFLLDRAGKRLCLYDSGAQFLSGFPLPQEIRERNLERFQVFWTRDGLFSFVDLAEGKVWQYAELRSTGGSGDWRLRNTINLPLGMDACVWEPFSRNPCCMRGHANQAGKGNAVCFDKYFSVIGGWNPPARDGGPRIEPVGGEASWRIVFDPAPACGSAARYSFSPDKGGFSSDSTRPEPGPIPREP
jgi:hypothetical protein